MITVSLMHTAMASYAECANGNDPKKGPPWDPCRYFESKDVPSDAESAKKYLTTVPQRIKAIRNGSITIGKLDQLGLIGNESSRTQNGAALELLMWQAGFKKPKLKPIGIYSYKDFYNGQYGYNFKYLILPFKYIENNTLGWKRCQPLRYTPTKFQIINAKKIISGFDNFIQALTKPYESKPADEETAQELYERQSEFNAEALAAVKAFDYDSYMTELLTNYTKIR